MGNHPLNLMTMKTLTSLYLAVCRGASAQTPMPNVQPKTNLNVELAWEASTTPGVTYVIRRGIAPGVYLEMVEISGLAHTWAKAPANLTNYFVVSAKNAAGESDLSNELKLEPRARPNAPNLKTAVPITVQFFRGDKMALEVGPFYAETEKPDGLFT